MNEFAVSETARHSRSRRPQPATASHATVPTARPNGERSATSETMGLMRTTVDELAAENRRDPLTGAAVGTVLVWPDLTRSRRIVEVNVYAAKSQLSELLRRVAKGEEVIITRHGEPVARLVSVQERAPQRKLGGLAGKIGIAPDFDAPLSDEI